MLPKRRHIHLIGIGGVGMTPLALYYKEAGNEVSGSDLSIFRMLPYLAQENIQVFFSQSSENIHSSIDQIVYSTAIPHDNQELVAARALGIPCMTRIEALQKIVQDKKLLSVTGSYGKSTTTTFLSSMFQQAGFMPSWLIGADMLNYPICRKTEGDFFILETDESRPEFLNFCPEGLVVTNIGVDHLQNYQHDATSLAKTLYGLMSRTKKSIVGPCSLQKIYPAIFQTVPIITCGFQEGTYQIQSIETEYNGEQLQTIFSVKGMYSQFQTHILMPSLRNVLDAVFSFALLESFSQPIQNPDLFFKNLPILERRFQFYPSHHEAFLVDDEGDSPEVIQSVLEDAKKYFPDRAVIAVLQPHRYSRLENLLEQYVRCVEPADQIIVLPVFEAGETPHRGVTSTTLYHAIQNHSSVSVELASSLIEGQELVAKKLNTHSIIITLGPGDVWKIMQGVAV